MVTRYYRRVGFDAAPGSKVLPPRIFPTDEPSARIANEADQFNGGGRACELRTGLFFRAFSARVPGKATDCYYATFRPRPVGHARQFATTSRPPVLFPPH